MMANSNHKQPVSNLVIGLLALTIVLIAQFVFIPPAGAADNCIVDKQGANDEPGQKDLNEVCIDDANAPTTVDVGWNWDETAWSGNNTGDACLLFDTDSDGNANTAACLYVSGSPAAMSGYQLYTCNDSRTDRCAGKQEADPVDGSLSSCSAGVLPQDPFDQNAVNGPGDQYPNDTVASCTIDYRDIGGDTAKPIDVCSYPSGEPNSDPSDCVIQPDDPTAVSLAGTLGGSADTSIPRGPLAAVAAMAGVMVVALLLWKRQESGQNL